MHKYFLVLRETGGLKINFEFGKSILCFRQCPQQDSPHPMHCDIE